MDSKFFLSSHYCKKVAITLGIGENKETIAASVRVALSKIQEMPFFNSSIFGQDLDDLCSA